MRALVDRFYDLMDLEPQFTELSGRTAANSLTLATSCTGSSAAGSGGPDHYIDERFGHPRLRARHLPFAFGVRKRDSRA